MKCKIINYGCHDSTECTFNFNEEQFDFLKMVFDKLNKNSACECMPLIYVFEEKSLAK